MFVQNSRRPRLYVALLLQALRHRAHRSTCQSASIGLDVSITKLSRCSIVRYIVDQASLNQRMGTRGCQIRDFSDCPVYSMGVPQYI